MRPYAVLQGGQLEYNTKLFKHNLKVTDQGIYVKFILVIGSCVRGQRRLV